MNAEKFIDVIRTVVRDAAIADTFDVAANPPGRRISQAQRERADWLKKLDESEREIVTGLIRDAADNAIFGFLCVVDGVRAIEDGPVHGQLELTYVCDTERVQLNDPKHQMLHDIFNAED